VRRQTAPAVLKNRFHSNAIQFSAAVANSEIFANDSSIRSFRRLLLGWYRIEKRDLPWRNTRDPYRIWVSEIMLQQTRVAAVLEHYRKFLKRFSSVRKLAAASEAEVLAAWSGLGYYRRARMLHQASRIVTRDYRAHLPQTADQLRQLPGIGRYTANAIASIGFSEPVAVVDGNVERVLSRISEMDLGGEALWTSAQTLLDRKHPGDFNQAMMELGAVVCVPGVPDCVRCPVKPHCASRGASTAQPKASERRLSRSASFVVGLKNGRIRLRQRGTKQSLMAGMWELPESSHPVPSEPILRLKHSITNTDWTIQVFRNTAVPLRSGWKWISLNDVQHLPLTGLTRKVLRKLDLLQ
jgi:A/G-specific adenine glycosylase